MYYGCYGSLLLVAFILIPFAYFYHEEERFARHALPRPLHTLLAHTEGHSRLWSMAATCDRQRPLACLSHRPSCPAGRLQDGG